MKKNFVIYAILTLSIALALFAFRPLKHAQAATQVTNYIVTRTDDPPPGNCQAGDCSLREAILAANANPGLDYIGLTIDATYGLSIPPNGINNANTGDLNITDDLNFYYPGMICLGGICQATIKGVTGWLDRILSLENNAEVHMFGLTIKDGSTFGSGGGVFIFPGSSLYLSSCTIYHNAADGLGGGIYNAGTLALSNSYILGNYAGNGGGIYNEVNAHLTVSTPSYIMSNTVVGNGDGGGLWISNPADAQLSKLTVQQNHADGGWGGGLFYQSTGQDLQLTHSNVLSNTATDGGGIFLGGGSLTVQTVTISGNSASGDGGGISVRNYQNGQLNISHSNIANNRATNGGGIGVDWDSTAQITMTNVTVSGNTATNSGGGLMLSTAWLYNVTVTNNSSDWDFNQIGLGGGLWVGKDAYIANSVLGANPRGSDCYALGTLHSLDYNLIQTTNHCTPTGDIFHNKMGVAPLLGPLANNGGETLTHMPLAGSPLQEAGNPFGCAGANGSLLTTDQRGWSRPVGLCEMGAVEIGAIADSTPPETSLLQTPSANDPTPTFAFQGNDGVGGSGVTGFDCQLDGGIWFNCTSPYTFAPLSNGSHTFKVRAYDLVGNMDATPESFTWTLQAAYFIYLPSTQK